MTDSQQPFDGVTDMPAALVEGYVAAFNAGSSALVDRFYESDAVLIPQPGNPVSGASERRAAYDHLLGFGVPMIARPRHLFVAGDIALSVVDWSLRGTARQGFPIDMAGTAADVLRRGFDGSWRYLINNPFGTA